MRREQKKQRDAGVGVGTVRSAALATCRRAQGAVAGVVAAAVPGARSGAQGCARRGLSLCGCGARLTGRRAAAAR